MLTLAREAMATRFELVLPGENTVALRAAGEEVLDEIERLHQQLNLYSPQSEVAHLNANAAHGPVRVTPNLFRLLEHAKRIHAETGGAFDITIGPLMRCWGLMGNKGIIPSQAQIQEALSVVGMDLVKLDSNNFTVSYERPGVMIDLGAIGKGYAVERAIDLLRELGIPNAFLHGGTSTCYGLGRAPDDEAWKVALHYPALTPQGGASVPASRIPENPNQQRLAGTLAPPSTDDEPAPGAKGFSVQYRDDSATDAGLMAVVLLQDEGLSVSALRGKFFEASGKIYGHIIDPRTGYPASGAIYAVVGATSATETDALSTALLTSGPEAFEIFCALRNRIRILVVGSELKGGALDFRSQGISLLGSKPT